MKTAKDIQDRIFTETGIKTSVKKGTGSMKGYLIISPMFQGGLYPEIPFDLTRVLKSELADFDFVAHPLFCSTASISVFGISDERADYKKERKPNPIESTKGWGSKNSQVRLDKAIRRYAKRLQSGNCARYY